MNSQAIEVKNLAELKRLLKKGSIFEIVEHLKTEKIGMRRVVNIVQTNGVYSVIQGDPENPDSVCNYGKGTWTAFGKASQYQFGTTIRKFRKPIGSPDNKVIVAFRILRAGGEALSDAA